ncbi:MAG: gliding motility-associated C-terminal domain-containing protein [Paludibacter sp.]|nr:gliding motility-associated C-terminal domain-containing protein [Paludibacter sp.]
MKLTRLLIYLLITNSIFSQSYWTFKQKPLVQVSNLAPIPNNVIDPNTTSTYLTTQVAASNPQRAKSETNYNATGCVDNLDFEFGNFTNWLCYTGTAMTNGTTNYVTWTPTTPVAVPIANRIQLISAASIPVLDKYGNFPRLCPTGGNYTLQLGSEATNKLAEKAACTFVIPATALNYSITYYYAVVFQDPNHPQDEQPRFQAKVYDANNSSNVIACASYDYTSTSGLPGFYTSALQAGGKPVLYKPWSAVTINLSGYAGHTVTLEFTAEDCTLGGHFGYAYVDVSSNCSSLVSNYSYCEGTPSLTLTAPDGYQTYTWWNNDYSQNLGTGKTVTLTPAPTSSTTVNVDLVPYSGFGCRDTAFSKIIVNQPTSHITNVSICQGSSYVFNGNTYSSPGLYDYHTTNKAGCDSTSTLNLTVNPLPTAAISGTTTVCQNSINPLITFTGSDGTAPYTFSYKVNGVSQFVTTTVGNSVTVSAPTNVSGTFVYSLVSVQDASTTSCLNPQSGIATVVIIPLPTATIGGTTTVCQNDPSQNISFTGSGGTAPYTFTYKINGIMQPVVTSVGNIATVAAPTNVSGNFIYSLVSVKDASSLSCSNPQSGTATVTVNPLPTATITGTATVCQNDVSPLITLTGSGGTAPYTFNYTINGVLQPIITSPGNSITLSVPTNVAGNFAYSLVSVKNSGSSACSNIQSGTATVTVLPLALATINGTTTVCQNDVSPNITFTGSGGTAPYTFTYTINGVAQPVVTSVGNSITVAVPTATQGIFVYSLVSVKDAVSAGCSNFQAGTATVTVNPLPTAIIAGNTTVCQNDANPIITLTGSGGTAPYTFTYKINGVNQPVVTSVGNSATVSVPTFVSGTFTYSLVSVKDASTTGCTNLQSGIATVIINPLPTAIINGTTTVCQNDPSPVITFTGAGSTAPYTFTYKINGIIQPILTSAGNSITIAVPTNTAGTFIYSLVSVKDASSVSCSNLQNGNATVTINPLPSATIVGTSTVCQNDVSPIITFTGSGGTAPYTFNYLINGVNQTVTTTVGNSVTVTVPTNVAGTFIYSLVSVKDASTTTCSNPQSGSVSVTINPLPTAVISGTATVCQNGANPIITFTGSGGTAPYTFTYKINGINQPVVTSVGNSATVAAPTTISGTFVYSLVSVKDASSTSCLNLQSGTATVMVISLPTATINGTTSVCLNDVSPNVTFTGLGGTAPYTFSYQINGVNKVISTTVGNSVTVSAPTNVAGLFTYKLISVVDSKSCPNAQSGNAVITVNSPTSSTLKVNICQGQSYVFNGTTYSSTGVYSKHFTNATGCDSIAKLDLTVILPGYHVTNASVCIGSSYTFNGTVYTSSGTYTSHLIGKLGCDSTDVLILSVNNTTVHTTNASICPGETYTLGGITYSTPGTYTSHLVNSTGCDSTSILKLTMKLPTSSITNAAICPGESYTFSGTTYNTAGTYSFHFNNAAGCDSTATLKLTIKLPTTSVTNAAICQGESYVFNGTTYNSAGSYVAHLTNVAGCDSTATLNLSIKLPTTSTRNQAICQGDSIMFNGTICKTAGTYTTHLTNAAGCDSTAVLKLTVKLPSSSTINQSICQGTTYMFNGTAYSLAGIYKAHLVNSQGCDSTVTLNLTIKLPSSSITNKSICQGDTYTFNSVTYNSTGTYIAHLTNKVGCDSTATLHLTVNLPTASSVNEIICQGTPYVFNGTTYTSGGTYKVHLTNVLGCDSVITLNLTLVQPTSSTTNASICQGDTYTFNGVTYNATGSYIKHLTNAAGCDSVATLVLKVKPKTSSTTNVTICQSESYTFNGTTYNSSGTYSTLLVNKGGCDSTAILNLRVKQPTTSNTNAAICFGDSYKFGGKLYNLAGTYTAHLKDEYGCDSTAILNLSLKLPSVSTINASICQGDSYTMNGVQYTSAGTYIAHLTNVAGCDSTATLHLTVKKSSVSTTNATICQGETYIFNGENYTTAGIHSVHLVNAVGCDSLATLNLYVNQSSSSTTHLVVSSAKLPFIWNNTSYSEEGTYTSPIHFVNAAGCDSTAILILKIKTPSTSNTYASICDGENYWFNGVNYFNTGIYASHLVDSYGIDSTAILNLKVDSVYHTTNKVLLVSGEKYSINGNVYDQSGTYTDVLKTVNGCDSTVVTEVLVVDVPNTITPNGDGVNDVFMRGWHVKIYNRNGILLYNGTQGWDCKYNNNPVSMDTYFYVLFYKSGYLIKTKEGYLTVIR